MEHRVRCGQVDMPCGAVGEESWGRGGFIAGVAARDEARQELLSSRTG